MSSKTKSKADKPENETIDGAQATAEQGNAPTDESGDQPEPEELSEAAPADGVETGEPETPAAERINLHDHLTKAVQTISATGGQEKVFALHQIELLTGRLKMAIPAGIAAADDAGLKAGLEALLALL